MFQYLNEQLINYFMIKGHCRTFRSNRSSSMVSWIPWIYRYESVGNSWMVVWGVSKSYGTCYLFKYF